MLAKISLRNRGNLPATRKLSIEEETRRLGQSRSKRTWVARRHYDIHYHRRHKYRPYLIVCNHIVTSSILRKALDDTEIAVIVKQKEKLILSSVSPPPEDNTPIPELRAGRAHLSIDKEKVRRAPFDQALYKTPGYSRFNFRAIRLVWK
jgi:hypothetical protein